MQDSPSGQDLVGRVHRLGRVGAALLVLWGFGMLAGATIHGLTVFERLLLAGMGLISAFCGVAVWPFLGSSRPAFVISREGIAGPFPLAPVVQWVEIAEVRVREPVAFERALEIRAHDPQRQQGPWVLRLAGRVRRRSADVLWLHERDSPVPFAELIHEIQLRYEAAIGRPLPLIVASEGAAPARRDGAFLKLSLALAVLMVLTLLVPRDIDESVLAFCLAMPLAAWLVGGRRMGSGLTSPARMRIVLRRELPASLAVAGVAAVALVLRSL